MEYGVISSQFVDYINIPYMAEPCSPFQLIEKANQKVAQRSLSSLFNFLAPSPGFLMFALAGCLVYWVVSSLLSRFQKSARIKSLPTKGNLQMRIVFFFFTLLFFFIQLLYCNSLSTENLIVRTDDLLFSREQILKTEREFCFLEGGSSSEEDFFKKASLSLFCWLLTS